MTLECTVFVSLNLINFFGGECIVCQIDEILFRHKPKCHRCRATEFEIWVFGVTDTSYSPSKVCLKGAPNRSEASFLSIIVKIYRPRTMIHSDKWKAFENLQKYGFKHFMVNNSLPFVDQTTLVNTQRIESY